MLENGKNAPLDIKSPVKNFHGRAKGGGIAPWPPPKYATACKGGKEEKMKNKSDKRRKKKGRDERGTVLLAISLQCLRLLQAAAQLLLYSMLYLRFE